MQSLLVALECSWMFEQELLTGYTDACEHTLVYRVCTLMHLCTAYAHWCLGIHTCLVHRHTDAWEYTLVYCVCTLIPFTLVYCIGTLIPYTLVWYHLHILLYLTLIPVLSSLFLSPPFFSSLFFFLFSISIFSSSPHRHTKTSKWCDLLRRPSFLSALLCDGCLIFALWPFFVSVSLTDMWNTTSFRGNKANIDTKIHTHTVRHTK